MLVNSFGGLFADAVFHHPGNQSQAEVFHLLVRALVPHGAAEFIGLHRRKPGRGHRYPHSLFLEQRHAERSFENRFQYRVRVGHLFFAVAPPEIGMHHVALNRPGTNQGHLNDEIIKPLGPVSRERIHLRARFHLEHADRVGLLQQLVYFGIIVGQFGRIDSHAMMLLH